MKAYQIKQFLLTVATGSLLSFALTSPVAQAFTIDTGSREQSRTFYNAVYPASDNVPLGWTGNLANGNPGSTSPAFKSSVFLRVNFFRALAGIRSEVSNNPSWSDMDQSAALMMSANGALSHTPPVSWQFYSVPGMTAAGKSNLALSNYGADAISSYMEDAGAVNSPVGHRRWILFPQTQQMGTGDVPATGSNYAANALWTLDLNHYADARPTVRDEFIAWPPKGYVPYQLIYPRWSFSFPDADFSAARVVMTKNNVAIPVGAVDYVQGYGENTLVFVPNNINADAWAGPVQPAGDVYYSVSVRNVIVRGVPRNFDYNVVAFDPSKPGSDTPSLTINGPGAPKAGVNSTYSVAAQVLATGYQWKYSAKAAYAAVLGAESNAGVTTKVPGGYSFRDKKVKDAGSYSYHLTHPNFIESSFTLRDAVFCSGATKLNFSSRLAYATNYQTATVEVSTDGGNQWTAVWSQAGNNGPGEGAFVKRTISLAGYQGREVKVRFRYALRQGSAFTQTDDGVGWYVDSISFFKGEKLMGTKTSGVSPNPQFVLKPAAASTYVMQVRAQVLGNYYRDWSVAKAVKAK